MGSRYTQSEIEKAQIKVLNDKGYLFSVIAWNMKKSRKVMSNFLQDPEAYGTKLVGWLLGIYGGYVGYLTPNSVYLYIYLTNEYLVGNIFYKQDFTCLHMINQF